ncbi:unnamed protein product, partial [Pneumocystis jirovecii]
MTKVESIVFKVENTTIYKIANLIQFYKSTLQKILQDNSYLLKILDTNLSADVQLNPPSFLIDAVSEFKIISESFKTTYGSSESLENEFEIILEIALNPYCELCHDISNKLSEPHKSIFLINCWKICEKFWN